MLACVDVDPTREGIDERAHHSRLRFRAVKMRAGVVLDPNNSILVAQDDAEANKLTRPFLMHGGRLVDDHNK
jgi:hypothetical protein